MSSAPPAPSAPSAPSEPSEPSFSFSSLSSLSLSTFSDSMSSLSELSPSEIILNYIPISLLVELGASFLVFLIWKFSPWPTLSFLTGLLCASLARRMVARIMAGLNWVGGIGTERNESRGGPDGMGVYGIDHGVLNLELPPKSMWMNMGYWRDKTKDLNDACPALLLRVLHSAGLLWSTSNDSAEESDHRGIRILDVGIGCGDQTRLLHELSSQKTGDFPPILSYVGLNHSLAQHKVATSVVSSFEDPVIDEPKKDMEAEGDVDGENPPEKPKNKVKKENFRVFRTDGSDPSRWDYEVKAAVTQVMGEGEWKAKNNKFESPPSKPEPGEERWLFGLDSLYHLQPSREPLIRWARSRGASIAAFDLLLPSTHWSSSSSSTPFASPTSSSFPLPASLLLADDDSKGHPLPDNPQSSIFEDQFGTGGGGGGAGGGPSTGPSRWQRHLLDLACRLMGVPPANLLTPEEYGAMLVDAGYDIHKIQLEDVTAHVFGPLAAFLRRRDEQLAAVGVGMAKFRFAGWLFDWWARTGIVRAFIVVARV